MDPTDLVEEYLRALSAADVNAVVDLVSEDFVNEHTSALGSSTTGRGEYADRLPRFLSQFAGLQYEVIRIIAAADGVSALYRMTANFNGHPIDITGSMWFTVENDRIAHRVDVWDGLTFLRQTGAIEER